jgi:hypothetical protein
MKRFGLFVLCSVLAASVQAQSPQPSPASEWYRAGHVSLRLENSAGDFAATWQFDRADNGDNRVIRDEQRAGTLIKGTVMSICDDQALVMTGLKPAPRHEMQELDEPVLHLQMLLRLLARAAPEGPVAFGGDKLVEISEPATAIRVRKGLEARRDFNAPWQARGRIRRDAGGEIAYEIVFNHAGDTAAAPRSELKLAGSWRQGSRAASFDSAFDIADWQVYRVNPVPVSSGGSTAFEMMAGSKPLRYATLGHLRRHIERAWSANPKVAPLLECKP